MVIDAELLSQYVGGQVKVSDPKGAPLYLGAPKNFRVEDGGLSVDLSWLARWEDSPAVPGKWVGMGTDKTTAKLLLAIPVGPDPRVNLEDGRFSLVSVSGNATHFFLWGDPECVHPSRVDGLRL